ncbi:hypothetical protein CK203_061147 [Vitis vinifera]|uniref:Uncharacterized protein n=1 Tax=Vitis vinifera TaxID=29760 RepID=A0A438GCA7_VITVI|nr:hypothetical protein CK203_061147 [Vitis vinifera]
MPVSSLGGRCWFSVELKTFEISIEEHKEKCMGRSVKEALSFLHGSNLEGKWNGALMENHTPAQALSSSIIRDLLLGLL